MSVDSRGTASVNAFEGERGSIKSWAVVGFFE